MSDDDLPTLCCIYKKQVQDAWRVVHVRQAHSRSGSLLATQPWVCPTCKMQHAVKCEPEPSNDAVGWEAWVLAEEIAQIHCVLRGRKRAEWRRILTEHVIDRMANSTPTTTATLDEMLNVLHDSDVLCEAAHQVVPYLSFKPVLP